MKKFHLANHLDETCHYPGERERQVCDLQEDFPHFSSAKSFSVGKFWVATNNDGDIVGSIGLLPDENEPEYITWLNTFSVAKDQRGKNLGYALFVEALHSVQTERVRLVTLGNHSRGIDVMGLARRMYNRNGFVEYNRKAVSFGYGTTIDLLYYEKKMHDK